MKDKITKEEKLEIELECLRSKEMAEEITKIAEDRLRNHKEFDMDVNYLFEPDNNIEF